MACYWPAEGIVGGLDVFLPYVRDYVSTFTGKSITTWDWKAHLLSYFEANGTEKQLAALKKVDWDVRASLNSIQYPL
jgi:leukotriene-A4 hydrolase